MPGQGCDDAHDTQLTLFASLGQSDVWLLARVLPLAPPMQVPPNLLHHPLFFSCFIFAFFDSSLRRNKREKKKKKKVNFHRKASSDRHRNAFRDGARLRHPPETDAARTERARAHLPGHHLSTLLTLSLSPPLSIHPSIHPSMGCCPTRQRGQWTMRRPQKYTYEYGV